jgi:hypothetical protein
MENMIGKKIDEEQKRNQILQTIEKLATIPDTDLMVGIGEGKIVAEFPHFVRLPEKVARLRYWIDVIDDIQAKITGVYQRERGRDRWFPIMDKNGELKSLEDYEMEDHYIFWKKFGDHSFRQTIRDLIQKRLKEAYWMGLEANINDLHKTPGEIRLRVQWKSPWGIMKVMPVFLLEVVIIALLALIKKMLKIAVRFTL